MKLAPFSMRTVPQLGIITLLPMAPSLLTMIALEEFLTRFLSAVF